MSKERVLITGGAGFIGRHVANALLRAGHDVTILDAMIPQVHGATAAAQIPDGVRLVTGDIRDEAAVRRALLGGTDAVVHLAAEVGVGQSMYSIARYVAVNDLGTAVLFEALAAKPVRRVVVASSMSVYGEGLYCTADGRLVASASRPAQGWDPVGEDGAPLRPIPTPEWKAPALASVYALTKYAQERMTLMLAEAYGMEAVALRLFNVFGPGQALSNPYTGVLAIFASRILNGERPLVFEDGRQRRDFVHVEDVASAVVAALSRREAVGEAINIGSGASVAIGEVADMLAAAMGRPDLAPEYTGRMRCGDIRHCFADIARARELLDFAPARPLATSLDELVAWVATETAIDRVEEARRELEERGLVA